MQVREVPADRADSRQHSSDASANFTLILALLGKRDTPTDAVDDYCRLLGGALEKLALRYQQARVPWDKVGRLSALNQLWRSSGHWNGSWALVQYTALMWSRRGFSTMFLIVLAVLKIRGVRVGVVFHDSQPYAGKRPVDRLRRGCQLLIMRWAYRLSDASILTIPLENISWLSRDCQKATFVPIGANVPATIAQERASRDGNEVRTIVVFAVTDEGDNSREVGDIVFAAKRAAERLCHVRLLTVGRGSERSASKFREAFAGSRVEFSALGLRAAEEVSQVLASADVSLFVRGPISTQRGSAMASIANGVPLVAYGKSPLPAPLVEAGLMTAPYPDRERLAEAVVRVLTDPKVWSDLHNRSRYAYEKYFSWEAVASRLMEILYSV